MIVAAQRSKPMTSPHHDGPRDAVAAYALSLLIVALALLAALLLAPVAGPQGADLVFLAAIVLVAIRCGLGPAVLGCVASVLAYNFFFVPPLHTLDVDDPTSLVTLAVFLLVALVTGQLAARARAEALTARRREAAAEALYAFSRDIAGMAAPEGLLRVAAARIGAMLRARLVLLVPGEGGEPRVAAAWPPDETETLEAGEARLAWSACRDGEREAVRVAGRLFLPLRAAAGVVGLVGLSQNGKGDAEESEAERRLLNALLSQVAVALERLRLGEERDAARLAVEAERLRSALLASLSHDLRTPLAAITGAVTALRQYGDVLDAGARDELAATAQEEAERMARFVANLLDMTRLASGAVALDRQPVDPGEVVGTALRRCEALLTGHRVRVKLAPDLPMLLLDAVLFEQVMVNLLDNAARYAPPGTAVTVSGARDGDGVVLQVVDEGPGLPPGDEERVFDRFHRVNRGDRQRAGTGLGLAICRGFTEALGGDIRARNRTDRSGAAFVLRFPLATVALPVTEAPE